MSKIAITAKTVNNPAKFISHVKDITGIGISDIRNRLDNHLAIAEFKLFLNNHDDVVRQLRELLTLEESGEGTVGIYELMPDEEFARCSPEECQISPTVLNNILSSHDEGRLRRESET